MIPETPVGAGPTGRGNLQRRFSGNDADTAGVDDPGAGGTAPIAASPARVLWYLTAVLRAKSVVEVGTGSGQSAQWLLRGMLPDGVLTSIDLDPDAHRAARAALSDAGIPSGRARLITGLASEVLPRLTEGAYDLVFVDAVKTEYPRFLELGVRLLRPGGSIVFAGLSSDQPNGPSLRDKESLALLELARMIQADENLIPVALPVGDGLLAVAKV